MANRGVQGRIVDAAGDGIAGLFVAAYDVEALLGDTFLPNTSTQNDPVFPGLVRTASDGSFSISYPENAYGLEARPDLAIRVYDRVKRLIYVSSTFDDVADAILDVNNVTIARPNAEGFAVTLGQGIPQFRHAGNQIEFLIDNAAGWERITQSVRAATTTIHILQLYIDVANFEANPAKDIPTLITEFVPPMPSTDGSQKPTGGNRLEKELLAAGQSPRNVAVRILVNDFIMLPYPVDTAGHVEDFFHDAPAPHTVEVRRFRMPIYTPMHAKVIVIDGQEAYLIGSPLVQEYFDDRHHSIDNPRRGPMGMGNAIRVPIHDMNTYIKGPTVADLDATFCLHWNAIAPTGAPTVNPVPPPVPQVENVSLQVLRTLRGDNRIPAKPHGETGILEGYLRAFANAKRFIYLENQYFTCDDIAAALVLALKQTPDVKLIMVLNNKVDIPFYAKYQRKLMQRLIRELPKGERDNRIGFFTIWSHEAAVAPAKSRLMRTYLHTKVGIVDNVWATVGSANLDSVGLKTGDHALLARTVGNVLFLGLPALADGVGISGYNVSEHRSSELNVAVFDDIPGASNATVDSLRRILWAEHLGLLDGAGNLNPNAGELADSPTSDWLAYWKDKSTTKLNGLKTNPPTVVPGRALRFPIDNKDDQKEWTVPKVDDPEDYLEALDLTGEEIERLELVEKIRSFSFETGKWE